MSNKSSPSSTPRKGDGVAAQSRLTSPVRSSDREEPAQFPRPAQTSHLKSPSPTQSPRPTQKLEATSPPAPSTTPPGSPPVRTSQDQNQSPITTPPHCHIVPNAPIPPTHLLSCAHIIRTPITNRCCKNCMHISTAIDACEYSYQWLKCMRERFPWLESSSGERARFWCRECVEVAIGEEVERRERNRKVGKTGSEDSDGDRKTEIMDSESEDEWDEMTDGEKRDEIRPGFVRWMKSWPEVDWIETEMVREESGGKRSGSGEEKKDEKDDGVAKSEGRELM